VDLDGRFLKRLTSVGSFLLVAGMILTAVSADTPWRKAIGVVLAGLGVTIAFLPGALAGRLIFDLERDTSDSRLGTAVRLWSAVMIGIGLGIMYFGLLQLFSPQAAARFINSRGGMGVLFIVGGSAVSFYYLVRFLGLRAGESTWRAELSLISSRLYSLAGMAVGLFFIASGLVLLLAPDLPGLLVRELLPALPTPPA
jgi:hypothetical protein